MTARKLKIAFIGARGVGSTYSGIENYYEEVGSRLAARGHEVTAYCRTHFTPDVPEYRDLDWEMAIFQADSVNAFAMPGGKIGVMTGILKAAQNQHQLAAVLGHEVAHVTARHANERASRGSFSNVGVQVAAVLLGGGNQGATYTAYEALNAGAALGIMLPFSRSQESEADVIGLEYMAKAGFDPREAVPLWQNMDAEAGDAPAEFLSTHPSSDTRIDQLVAEFGSALKFYNEAKEAGRIPNCSM